MEQTVNERLRLLIKTLNISQLEASKQLQVTPSTFGKWFSGDGTIRKSNLNLMCSTWNVNQNWLVNGQGEMFNEGGIKLERKVNGWKDEAFVKMEQLLAQSREEVAFYQRIIETLLPPTNSKESFQIASVGMGKMLEFCDASVRVAV